MSFTLVVESPVSVSGSPLRYVTVATAESSKIAPYVTLSEFALIALSSVLSVSNVPPDILTSGDAPESRFNPARASLESEAPSSALKVPPLIIRVISASPYQMPSSPPVKVPSQIERRYCPNANSVPPAGTGKSKNYLKKVRPAMRKNFPHRGAFFCSLFIKFFCYKIILPNGYVVLLGYIITYVLTTTP